jgi:hypothetical protein
MARLATGGRPLMGGRELDIPSPDLRGGYCLTDSFLLMLPWHPVRPIEIREFKALLTEPTRPVEMTEKRQFFS